MRLTDIDSFKSHITGAILAGGRATRMGGQDKGLIPIQGKYMIEYVIAALRPQVNSLLISANRHQAQYSELGQCLVLADKVGYYDGPLAGMATCLQAAQTRYVSFVPCDSPLLSLQLVERLYTHLIQKKADISVAEEAHGLQPVFALMKRDLLPDLLTFLESSRERQTKLWYQRHTVVHVDFSDQPETFFNVNTPDEQEMIATRILSTHGLSS